MKENHNLEKLQEIATRLRLQVVDMIAPSGQGYVQQGLGAADIFTSLYFAEATMDPSNPTWEDRDRIFLTTAHNTAIFYATLAERGFFPVSELSTYVNDGSKLEINSSERMGAFVEATCGSLGQGLSVAIGCALSAKRQGRSSRYYVILGDGEMQEGQIWEAAMYAAHHRIDNVVSFVDCNGQQIDGSTDDVMSLGDLEAKWKAFGWRVLTCNGHDFEDLGRVISEADAARGSGIPTVVLMRTDMGRGVDFMEGTHHWHGIAPNDEQLANALAQLPETLGDY